MGGVGWVGGERETPLIFFSDGAAPFDQSNRREGGGRRRSGAPAASAGGVGPRRPVAALVENASGAAMKDTATLL